jgi:mono/diheme cytochrome c family protein
VTVRLRHTLLGTGLAALLCTTALASQKPADGKTAYAKFGCAGCHKINGQGGTTGTDLSHVGKTSKPADIKKKIENPKFNMANSVMPAAKDIGMKPADVANVTAYLATLK